MQSIGRQGGVVSKKARLLIGLAVLVLQFAVLSNSASAKTVYDYFYSGEFFTGAGSTAGPFTSGVDRVAFDNANEKILVLDNGSAGGDKLSKFTAAGVASPFSGLSGESSISTGELGTEDQLAVDNSGTSTDGNIYVTSSSQKKVLGYAPSGLSLPGFPIVNPTGAVGVAVDPQGKIWVSEGVTTTQIKQYNADGTATGKSITAPSSLNENQQPGPLAIDTNGNFYVSSLRPNATRITRKYTPTGEFLFNLTNISTVPKTITVDPTDNSVFTIIGGAEANKVIQRDENGSLITEWGPADPSHFSFAGLSEPQGVAINPVTHEIWVSNRRNYSGSFHVEKFVRSAPVTVPTVTPQVPLTTTTTATLRGVVNPDGMDTTDCHFEWGLTTSYGNSIPCAQGNVLAGASGNNNVTALVTGLEMGQTYHFRLSSKNANNRVSTTGDFRFRVQVPPELTQYGASNVNSDSATLGGVITPNGGAVSYHFEWGTNSSYGQRIPESGELSLASVKQAEHVSSVISGLTPGTEYHFRIVVQSKDLGNNPAGSIDTGDMIFSTFSLTPPGVDSCPNALVRKQTGATLLLDCRAYELVSAADTGGYDVESNLIQGQTPLPAYSNADGRVLYTVHFGAIPGSGDPTNRGGDPYVATRGATGWTTKYVGLQADTTPSALPFSSTLSGADEGLQAFAFGGPEICNPCFADGSTNVPVRLPNESLIEGMAGSLDPGPANPSGQIQKKFSGDGSHFVFGSTVKFEPAGNSGSLSIYDRNLNGGPTQVVSTLPNGSTMIGLGIAELDISKDGSRILIGKLVSTDGAGNQYWHLYMHVGNSPNSIDLTPGTTSGVLYGGMNDAGTDVYFTTPDQLGGGDTDSSSDLYLAEVSSSSATLSRVSAGIEGTGDTSSCDPVANVDGNNWNAVGGASVNSCGVVAIAGGGGVASGSGSIFFLSPEKLDGSTHGTQNQPNLYDVKPGSSPHYVTTLEPDNPAIRHAVSNSGTRNTADFQVTPDGSYSAFATILALTGANTQGHSEVFRYASSSGISCASCAPTNAVATTDVTLAPQGLNLSDDGRVFFTSSEQLVLRDTNRLKDAYEWENGAIQLISSGIDSSDSGLLSVSANGVNAYFFTRQTLAVEDTNGGAMKIYDARAKGGFLYNPPPFPCAASDECHGPGTQAASQPSINTVEGTGESQPGLSTDKRCRRGFVKKRGGQCLKKRKGHSRHKRHSTHHHG